MFVMTPKSAFFMVGTIACQRSSAGNLAALPATRRRVWVMRRDRSTFEQCPLCLQQRTSEFGSDYIRHSSSGSFATLAAIRRASSLLSNFAAERQKNLEGP